MGQGEKANKGMFIVDPIQGRGKKYLILVEYRYAFIKANVKNLNMSRSVIGILSKNFCPSAFSGGALNHTLNGSLHSVNFSV